MMKKNFRYKKGVALLIVFLLITAVSSSVIQPLYAYGSADISYSKEELMALSKGIVAWRNQAAGLSADADVIKSALSSQAGTTDSDWFVIAMAKLGLPGNYGHYLSSLTEVVKQRYKAEGKLSTSKATEWHRIALAVLACGGNPEAVGGSINLIADGTYNRGLIKPLNNQGNNGTVFALIALDAMNYEVPADAYESRADILQNLLSSQLSDGGFAQWGDSSDVDVTAMALTALAPYSNKYPDQIASVVSFLSSKQSENGGFFSGGVENAESAAQVIIALTSLGINPQTDARFIKNGNTPVSHLVSYVKESGGVCHTLTGAENEMAAQQTLCAIAALVRQMNGQSSLYRFTSARPSLEAPKAEYLGSEGENAGDAQMLEPLSSDDIISGIENESDDAIENSKDIEVSESESSDLSQSESAKQGFSNSTLAYMLLAAAVMCFFLGFKIFKGRKKDLLILAGIGFMIVAVYFLANPQTTEKHYEERNKTEVIGTVTVFIDCSVVFDHWDELDQALKSGEYLPEDGVILKTTEYPIEEGDTAFDVLLDAVTQNKIHLDYQGGDANMYDTVYIKGIQYLYEFSCGRLSGWTYAVNGEFPDVGCSSYLVSDGDAVEWLYTCDLGRDVGNVFQGENE